jgi:CelD/BcsL family acetyltransferase involved in cellulose biosynthesis
MMLEHGISARVVTPFELEAREIAIWERLSTSTPSLGSPFLSPHYARAVAESGIDVRICVIYRGSAIRGFFPYQFRNPVCGWARTAEPVGGEMTDYVGVVAEPGLTITSRQLLKLAKVNYFGFSHLDETQLKYGLHAEQPRIGLRVRLSPGGGRPLESLLADQKKYIKDSERRARQLSREVGPINFILDVQGDRREVLNKLISEKRSQYQRTNAPDALAKSWKYKLLNILSEYQFDTCRGILSTISAGDQWIAAHFGIIGNGILQYWFPVYNQAFAKYAPGRLLIHQIIDSARKVSIHTIDRGEGDNSSKRELANEEHSFFRGTWHNATLASQVTRGFYSLKWRLGS